MISQLKLIIFDFKKKGEKVVTIKGAINAKVKAFAREITEIE